jgi:hypothetical protein
MSPRNSASDRQKIERYPLSDISLDLENPRLVIPPGSRERDVLKIMVEREALDELALSFAENGYFLEEPIVLVPNSKNDGFIVVEGNRRVATLKLLLDGDLRKALGINGWPDISETRRADLEDVPAVVYGSRAEVVPYLGFRHISGIKTWDPFQKARYVASLVNEGRRIPEIERSVGDRSNSVRKLYQSYVVYEQITRDLSIPSRVIEGSYSLLEVALGQSAIKKFLSVPTRLPMERTEAVVPEERLSELREIVSWIFGDPTQRQDRIITDSRQISQRLAPILLDPYALEFLRNTRDLEGAYEYSGGEQTYLEKQLAAVRRAAQRALGLMPSYRNEQPIVAAIDALRPLLAELLGD